MVPCDAGVECDFKVMTGIGRVLKYGERVVEPSGGVSDCATGHVVVVVYGVGCVGQCGAGLLEQCVGCLGGV